MQFRNGVDKAQKLSNKINFRWVAKVIHANAMVVNNGAIVAEEGGEVKSNVLHNTESAVTDVVVDMGTNVATDGGEGEASNDNVNDTLPYTREVVTNRIRQEGEEEINPADVSFQLSTLNENVITPAATSINIDSMMNAQRLAYDTV